MKRKIALVLIFAMIPAIIYADSEARNSVIVKSATSHSRYAKSIPADHYGQRGKTYIYKVEKGEDKLECEYNWYSASIYLGGIWDGSLVRFGPWNRGHKPSDDHFAIGFYRNGKTIKEYSAMDIIKAGSGLSGSISHYQVFGKRIGFRRWQNNTFVFEVHGAKGKLFTFNVDTGLLINEEKHDTKSKSLKELYQHSEFYDLNVDKLLKIASNFSNGIYRGYDLRILLNKLTNDKVEEFIETL